MSANNFILIRQRDNGECHVAEYDADTGFTIEEVGIYKSSLDALEAAQKHQNDNEVEYGIQYEKVSPT